MLCTMKPPLSLRPLLDAEHTALAAGRRNHEAFTVHRYQIWLASVERQHPSAIAKTLCGALQMVRNVLHAFARRGLASVQCGLNVSLRSTGLSQLSPSGCMGNEPSWRPFVCSPWRNSYSRSVPTSSG